jgi:anti-sigma factor RsiW
MGSVTRDCEQVRGMIALSVLGDLDDDERVTMLAHLDGCPECREEERELGAVAAVLPEADLGRLEPNPVPSTLSDAVLGRLEEQAHRRRRNRRIGYLVGGSVAAAAVALGLVVSLGSTGALSESVALSGPAGAHASARLTAESWGTAVHVVESGQSAGEVLWVSMRTSSGGWWQTGTFTSDGARTVSVDMACALRLSRIESVWVRDATGHVVMHGYAG